MPCTNAGSDARSPARTATPKRSSNAPTSSGLPFSTTNENTDIRSLSLGRGFVVALSSIGSPTRIRSSAPLSPQFLTPERLEEPNRRSQPDRPRSVRGSCFKFECAFREACRSGLQLYLMHHIASRLKRWHRIEKLASRPQGTDAHRTAHLVS